MLYSSSWDQEKVICDEDAGVLAINPDVLVYGDMTLVCYEPLQGGKRNMLFRYWVHTAFLPYSKDSESGEETTVDGLRVTEE